eukprot:1077938-Amorphochlora_amoeboformis.AAC.1
MGLSPDKIGIRTPGIQLGLSLVILLCISFDHTLGDGLVIVRKSAATPFIFINFRSSEYRALGQNPISVTNPGIQSSGGCFRSVPRETVPLCISSLVRDTYFSLCGRV